MLRIGVDFNTMYQFPSGIVDINADFEPKLLGYLYPGLRVILYEMPDLEVEAIIEVDEKGRWYGIPDWSTRKDLSEEKRPKQI